MRFQPRQWSWFSVLPALLAGGLGALVLVGWLQGSAELTQLSRALSGTPANSALGLLLGCAALLALAAERPRAGLPCALGLLAFAGLSLVEYAAGVDLGVATLLGRVFVHLDSAGMPANTALCLVLIGAALCLLTRPAPFRLRAFALVALPVAAATLALAVVLARGRGLVDPSWALCSQMSVQSAAGVLMLALALACAVRCDLLAQPAPRRAAPVGATPWAVLGIALAATCGAWYVAAVEAQRISRAVFEREVVRGALALEHRMDTHATILQGARRLVIESRPLDHAQWHSYAELEQPFPGLQGLGFSPRIAARELAAHVAVMRGQGVADYRVWPPGQRSEYQPIVHLEPHAWRNQRELGYDLASVAGQRDALDQARDTGRITLSRAGRLQRDTRQEAQPLFSMYLPVYRGGSVPPSVAGRRAALLGFVHASFRARDLLRSALANGRAGVAALVFDGDGSSADGLLFASDTELSSLEQRRPPSFSAERTLEIADRTWTVRFRSRPAFERDVASRVPWAVLSGGLLVAFALSAMTWSLARQRLDARERLEDFTRRLRISEQRYQAVVSDGRALVCSHDLDGVLLYVNPAAASALEGVPDDFIGRSLVQFIAPAFRADFGDYLTFIRSAGRHSGRLRMITLGGRELLWAYDNVVIHDGESEPYVLGHAESITEVQQLEHKLASVTRTMRDLAARDNLTGLRDRTVLYDHLERALADAGRAHRGLALLLVNLDHFKAVNDAHGYAVGDQLLQQVADDLKECMRANGQLVRLGGDEFAIILGRLGMPSDARGMADQIVEHLHGARAVGEVEVEITGSVGLALHPNHGAAPEALWRNAEAALYEAKRAGRDTWRECGDGP